MIQGPLSERLLDGRYRVGELVGSGGFGHVYAAIHLGLAGKVAIKVPRIDDLPPAAISTAIARFLDEGRTLKRLRHPALVAALDVGLLPPDADGIALPYLVLEWCDGCTLKEWRGARPGPMRPPEAWALLRPAFAAIAHAHREGVVHRDLKPTNILIEETRDGVVPRVIDFGIAKILGPEADSSGATRTTSSEPAFTPRYAAPEQLTGLRSGPRTDVYALALVLCEVLRGEPVFATDDDARRAVMEANLPTPATLGLDFDRWNAPIARALAPRPVDRHADAEAFLRALDEALAGTPDAPSAGGSVAPLVAADPASPSHRAAGAIDDESVAPSSHTLRTRAAPGTAPTASRRSASRPGLAAAAAIVVAGAVVLLPLGGVDALRRWTSSAPADGAGARATPSSPTPEPSAPAPAPRALRDTSPQELVDRMAAAGVPDCRVAAAEPAMIDVVCPRGRVGLADFGPPGSADRIWRETLRAAKAQAETGDGVRYTIDETIGLVVAAPEPDVDAVTAQVLAGYRHEPLRQPPPIPSPARIPGRLADWKGPEAATRIRAMGGLVQEEMSAFGVTSVLYRLDGKDGLVVHAEIEPDQGDAFLQGTDPPDAYAVDGRVALRVKGDGAFSRLSHLQKILGTTKASRMSERP